MVLQWKYLKALTLTQLLREIEKILRMFLCYDDPDIFAVIDQAKTIYDYLYVRILPLALRFIKNI